MKGIFKQALSVALLLSVGTSVFASESVVAPQATNWKASCRNAWTNTSNWMKNTTSKVGALSSNALKSAKDYVSVNGPKAVEYVKENKAKTAAAVAGTGLAGFVGYKAYRYFRPTVVKSVSPRMLASDVIIEELDAQDNVIATYPAVSNLVGASASVSPVTPSPVTPVLSTSLYPTVVIDAELSAQQDETVKEAQEAAQIAANQAAARENAERAANSFAAQMAASLSRSQVLPVDQMEIDAAAERQLAADQEAMIKAMAKNHRRNSR